MFEETFRDVLANLKTDKVLIDKLWKEIIDSYSTQDRDYHNLMHLDNLNRELAVVKNEIFDWHAIVFSIAYHDIIYDVSKKDNEEKSADYAVVRLGFLNLTRDTKDKCRQHILVTKEHVGSEDSDTNFFKDADLAILGSEYAVYKAYTEQIRKEYKIYPDLLYKPARVKVLKHFLQMTGIYTTRYFFEKYERQARENINRELKELI